MNSTVIHSLATLLSTPILTANGMTALQSMSGCRANGRWATGISDWAGRPKTADPLGLFVHVYKWYHWYMEEQETGFMEGVFFFVFFCSNCITTLLRQSGTNLLAQRRP